MMGASAAGAYEIERSLRFNNDADTATLTRTFSSAGVETFAGGVMVDVNGNVFTGGYQTANFYALFVKYNSSGTLQFQKEYYFSIGGSEYGGLGAASLNGNKGDLSNIQLYHTTFA